MRSVSHPDPRPGALGQALGERGTLQLGSPGHSGSSRTPVLLVSKAFFLGSHPVALGGGRCVPNINRNGGWPASGARAPAAAQLHPSQWTRRQCSSWAQGCRFGGLRGIYTSPTCPTVSSAEASAREEELSLQPGAWGQGQGKCLTKPVGNWHVTAGGWWVWEGHRRVSNTRAHRWGLQGAHLGPVLGLTPSEGASHSLGRLAET